MDLVTALETCSTLDGGAHDPSRTTACRVVWEELNRLAKRLRVQPEQRDDLVQHAAEKLIFRQAAIVLTNRTEPGARTYLRRTLERLEYDRRAKERPGAHFSIGDGDEPHTVNLDVELNRVHGLPTGEPPVGDVDFQRSLERLKQVALEVGELENFKAILDLNGADDKELERGRLLALERARGAADDRKARQNLQQRHKRARDRIVRAVDSADCDSGEKDFMKQILSRLRERPPRRAVP